MIIYIVVWTREGSTGSLGLGSFSAPQSKSFTTREKADEYCQKLISAAHLLGVTVDPRIQEGVIE